MLFIFKKKHLQKGAFYLLFKIRVLLLPTKLQLTRNNYYDLEKPTFHGSPFEI